MTFWKRDFPGQTWKGWLDAENFDGATRRGMLYWMAALMLFPLLMLLLHALMVPK